MKANKFDNAKQEFNRIIDLIENRAMASDGPVSPTLKVATEKELSKLWQLLQVIKDGFYEPVWVKSSDQMPEHNKAVFVFIPEEDNHITTGMWDISKKWVLLDEYRVPLSEVTYWSPMFEEPKDQTYNRLRVKDKDAIRQEDTTTYLIRTLQQKVYELEKEQNKKL